jgi:hypothetical protein
MLSHVLSYPFAELRPQVSASCQPATTLYQPNDHISRIADADSMLRLTERLRFEHDSRDRFNVTAEGMRRYAGNSVLGHVR